MTEPVVMALAIAIVAWLVLSVLVISTIVKQPISGPNPDYWPPERTTTFTYKAWAPVNKVSFTSEGGFKLTDEQASNSKDFSERLAKLTHTDDDERAWYDFHASQAGRA